MEACTAVEKATKLQHQIKVGVELVIKSALGIAAKICGNDYVSGDNIKIYGNAIIKDDAVIEGDNIKIGSDVMITDIVVASGSYSSTQLSTNDN